MRILKPLDNRSRTSRKCLGCGNDFYPLYNSEGKFCNNTCQQILAWSLKRERILCTGAAIVDAGPAAALRHVKRLFEEIDRSCYICGIEIWINQPVPLILDHIDGNSENYKLSNFRLICPNCDAQTPTYKSKNWGNGRYSRRERYRLGKSF